MAAFIIADSSTYPGGKRNWAAFFFFLFLFFFFPPLSYYSNVRMGEALSLPSLAVLGQLLWTSTSQTLLFFHTVLEREQMLFLQHPWEMVIWWAVAWCCLKKKKQSKQNNIYSQGGTIFVMFNLVFPVQIRNCLEAWGSWNCKLLL